MPSSSTHPFLLSYFAFSDSGDEYDADIERESDSEDDTPVPVVGRDHVRDDAGPVDSGLDDQLIDPISDADWTDTDIENIPALDVWEHDHGPIDAGQVGHSLHDQVIDTMSDADWTDTEFEDTPEPELDHGSEDEAHSHSDGESDGESDGQSDLESVEGGDDDISTNPAKFIAWAEANGVPMVTVLETDDADPSSSDQDNVDRFGRRIQQMLAAMVSWCRSIGDIDEFVKLGDERPMTDHWFLELCNTADVATLCQSILDAIPTAVQTILGQRQIDTSDLSRLPRLRLDCKDFGCYVSTATASSKKSDVHVYVDSSCSKKGGLASRMQAHYQAIARVRSGAWPLK